MNEKLKQRLVGAVVLASLAIIFIPMLLDGGERSGMPMFGSNIPAKPDYEFEPLDIPLQPVPPIAEERPVLIDKPEPPPQPTARTEEKAQSKPEPPVAMPKPAPAAPIADSEPSAWVVQVGSFSQSSNALALRDKLRGKGFTAFVEKLKAGGTTVYRVRIGPEIKRENAEKQLQRLQREMQLKGIVMGHTS